MNELQHKIEKIAQKVRRFQFENVKFKMDIYKHDQSEGKDDQSQASRNNEDIKYFLINQSTCSDIPTLKFLVDHYFDEELISLDHESASIIIDNLRKTLLSAEDELYYYVLKLIYLTLQSTNKIFELFEKLEMYDLIGVILSSSDIDESIVNLAYQILDTCFNSDDFNHNSELSIHWASRILVNLNDKITGSINIRKDISSPLSLSTFLLEKGIFSVEEMHNIFLFYIELLGLLNEKDQIDLPSGLHNLFIILTRFPCFYGEFNENIYELLFGLFDSKIPSIVEYTIEIFLPVISQNPQVFLDQQFIIKCCNQLQNPDVDFICVVLKALMSICSISEQACYELIESHFFQMRFNPAFPVSSLFLQIAATVVKKIPVEKEFVNDKFFATSMFHFISQFICYDDITLINCCLDIVTCVIRILGKEFIIDQELFENISHLIENNYDSQELSEKASFIVKTLNENASSD